MRSRADVLRHDSRRSEDGWCVPRQFPVAVGGAPAEGRLEKGAREARRPPPGLGGGRRETQTRGPGKGGQTRAGHIGSRSVAHGIGAGGTQRAPPRLRAQQSTNAVSTVRGQPTGAMRMPTLRTRIGAGLPPAGRIEPLFPVMSRERDQAAMGIGDETGIAASPASMWYVPTVLPAAFTT